MKKIVLSLIAVCATILLCSCVSSSAPQAAARLTTDILTGNTIENMTAEKAAGTYSLKELAGVAEVTAADYTQNIITLSEDGNFSFVVASADQKDNFSCTYTIASNGIITLSDKEKYLVAPGEKIVSNGSFIQIEGKMGAVSPKLLYEKNDDSNSTPETAPEVASDENSNVQE